jgi:hypothetical protein
VNGTKGLFSPSLSLPSCNMTPLWVCASQVIPVETAERSPATWSPECDCASPSSHPGAEVLCHFRWTQPQLALVFCVHRILHGRGSAHHHLGYLGQWCQSMPYHRVLAFPAIRNKAFVASPAHLTAQMAMWNIPGSLFPQEEMVSFLLLLFHGLLFVHKPSAQDTCPHCLH